MARIRTLKPEWLEDENLLLASPAARVASVALILLADDYGNGRGNIDLLVSRIFPRHPREGREGLLELFALGFARLYEVRGQTYFHIVNWARHQRVDKAGSPRVPPPSDPDAKICEGLAKIREGLAKIPGSLATDQDPGSRIQEQGGGGDTAPPTPALAPAETGYQRVRSHFDARYRERFGALPTWTMATDKRLATVLSQHSADEVIRRIDVLFMSPPKFLRREPPDIGTLVAHFDKLVQPSDDNAAAPRPPEADGYRLPGDGV